MFILDLQEQSQFFTSLKVVRACPGLSSGGLCVCSSWSPKLHSPRLLSADLPVCDKVVSLPGPRCVLVRPCASRVSPCCSCSADSESDKRGRALPLPEPFMGQWLPVSHRTVRPEPGRRNFQQPAESSPGISMMPKLVKTPGALPLRTTSPVFPTWLFHGNSMSLTQMCGFLTLNITALPLKRFYNVADEQHPFGSWGSDQNLRNRSEPGAALPSVDD